MTTRRVLPLLEDEKAKAVLQRLCEEHDLSLTLLRNLIDIQRDNLGRARQFGISQEFSAAISAFIDERTGSGDAT